LMTAVVEEYREAVKAAPLHSPTMPVIANISARPLVSASEIRDELAGQLTWPVRWTASIQAMVAQGVTHFVEIGPKDVLTGLVRRIDPSVQTISISDAAGVRALP